MIFRIAAVVAMVGGIVFACNGTLNPPDGPDTPYPCGVRGVSCGGGACCPEDHVCGYDGAWARCAPGYCCFDGPRGVVRDAGTRQTHPKG